jgi:hypothetical protein
MTDPDSQALRIAAPQGGGFTRIDNHRSLTRDGSMRTTEMTVRK